MSQSSEPKTRCPGWLLRLVSEVEDFEQVHSRLEDGEECFGVALRAVPSEVRAQAAGYVVAQREARAQGGEA